MIAAGARKTLILQHVGAVGAPAVRIGTTDLTAVTGMRLEQGQIANFSGEDCPQNVIRAISEGADTSVLVQTIT